MITFTNWSVLSVSFLFVLFIALASVALWAVIYLANGDWYKDIRHLLKPLFFLFPFALVLLIILLIGGEYTFPWLKHDPEHGPHLNAWHNYTFLVARQIIGLLFAMGLCWLFIKRQEVMDRSKEDAEKFHRVANCIPWLYFLYGSLVAFDFEMTLLPMWHSALFCAYFFISNFNMFLSFLVIWIYVLNKQGVLVTPVPHFVYNYLSQMMLGFTVLWMYTHFSQFLIIWYGNLPDERNRIEAMQTGDFSVLWYMMVAFKWFIPLFSLLMRKTRHTPELVISVAAVIITGTLIERFIWRAGINFSGENMLTGIRAHGSVPYLEALIGLPIIAAIGFFIVRGVMRRYQLLKA